MFNVATRYLRRLSTYGTIQVNHPHVPIQELQNPKRFQNKKDYKIWNIIFLLSIKNFSFLLMLGRWREDENFSYLDSPLRPSIFRQSVVQFSFTDTRSLPSGYWYPWLPNMFRATCLLLFCWPLSPRWSLGAFAVDKRAQAAYLWSLHIFRWRGDVAWKGIIRSRRDVTDVSVSWV